MHGPEPNDNEKAIAQGEVGSEVGMDEAWKANIKGQFDIFLNLQANAIKQAQQELAAINSTTIRALENSAHTMSLIQANAAETANLTAKQAVRAGDIAIDREWNVDEQGYTVAEILRDNTFKDAIAAAVSAAVNNTLASQE